MKSRSQSFDQVPVLVSTTSLMYMYIFANDVQKQYFPNTKTNTIICIKRTGKNELTQTRSTQSSSQNKFDFSLFLLQEGVAGLK